MTPRLWTPPLRDLDEPGASVGPLQAEFARDVLRAPLDPWQEWLTLHAGELLPDGRPRFRIVLVLVARQNGKALDVDTPILTTDGWSTMGALRVGDRVYHPDGSDALVTEAHPPRTDRQCYRVATTDGRSVVADAEHLWTVMDMRRATKRGRRGERPVVTRQWETLTTAQVLNRGLLRSGSTERSRDYAFRLPRQHAVKSPDVELPIDPYLFGAWLGDGGSRAAALTVGDEDVDEMRSLVEASGASVVSLVRHRTAWRLGFRIDARPLDGFQARCQRLGVWGNKHVPDLYLSAGTEQRMALLQGLLDTDGTIEAKRGQVEFCSTRRDLADAVLHLARSLGWRATSREGRAMLRGRDAGPRWRVGFTPDQSEGVPFRLSRKASRVQSGLTDSRHAVSIASIEPVESRPVRCIRVERPDGLFLAGRDLMVTHNTHVPVVLAPYWSLVDEVPMILGTSTKLDYARESWLKAVRMMERAAREPGDPLHGVIPAKRRDWVRQANGEQSWTLGDQTDPRQYKIAPANEEGGRSLTLDRLILDELRQHHDRSAWGAAVPAMSAVPDAQAWALSNAGSDKSVVLNAERAAALRFIETGDGDQRVGLFEWSAPEDADPTDPEALAMANPQYGRRMDPDALLGEATRAVAEGGEALATFQTEGMCIRVKVLDTAIDPGSWGRCKDPGSLAGLRSRLAVVVDVAPDGGHVTAYAAAVLEDGRVRVDPVDAWAGVGCVDAAERALPALLARVRPRVLGWFPGGPGAALAARLKDRKNRGWPPAGVRVEEITGETSAVCMGFEAMVRGGQVAHSGDALLDAHVAVAERLRTGDRWVFSRKGDGHCDAVYAAAGAAHLAKTMPAPVGRQRIVLASG